MQTHRNEHSDTWIVEYADGDPGANPSDIPAKEWHIAIYASDRSTRARCHAETQARQYAEEEAIRSVEQHSGGRVYRIREIRSGETRHLGTTVRRRANARTTTVTYTHEWSVWSA